MDLAFDYRIDTDLEALFVNDRTPTGNSALDRILARIAAHAEVCDTKTWIGVLSVEEAPAIHEQTLAGLVERGVLTVRESRNPVDSIPAPSEQRRQDCKRAPPAYRGRVGLRRDSRPSGRRPDLPVGRLRTPPRYLPETGDGGFPIWVPPPLQHS